MVLLLTDKARLRRDLLSRWHRVIARSALDCGDELSGKLAIGLNWKNNVYFEPRSAVYLRGLSVRILEDH